MARKSKRNRKPQPSRPYLRRSDRIKVVACLDYSLEHNLDLASIAVRNLDILRGYENEVAHKAIRSGLRGEYRDYGRSDGDISLEAFLAEGSAFLRYDKADLETLRVERSQIQCPSKKRYPLRSTPRTSTPRSRTLSSNPQPRSETASLSAHSTAELEGFDDLVAYSKVSKQQGRVSATRRTTTTKRLVRSSRTRGQRSPASTTSRAVALSTGVKEESFPASHAQAAEIAEITTPHSSQSEMQEIRLSALERELAAKNEELQAALRNVKEQQDYIFTLSTRLLAAEKECKEIEHSASKAAEHKDNVVMQRNLRYEYSVLRGQNINMISQRDVISMAATDSLRPSSQSIRKEFELILAGLKDACSSVNITLTPGHSVNLVTNERSVVESWSRRLASSSFEGLVSRALDNNISDIHIMTALSAVGTAELLFESNFPDFLARESPLLDQYREHILSRAGPKTLSELDLLAVHSILTTPDNREDHQNYFHSYILTNTANTLSSAVSDAFDTLISPNEHTMISAETRSPTDYPHLHHQPQAKPPSNPIAATFTEHLLRALKLKSSLLLSGSKYCLVFPHPGEKFDAATMIRDGESQTVLAPGGRARGWKDWHQMEGRVGEVKLCLFPALYQCARREGLGLERRYGVGVNVRNCLVECENFVKCGEEDGGGEGGMQGWELVVRAVVLV